MSSVRKLLLAIFCTSYLYANEPTVIKITPPNIAEDTICKEIVCIRPVRREKFNISLEKQKQKTIVHCYGHGGSGWTTLFGSVHKAIDLLKKSNASTSTPIRIIGSGCMGLTMAIELAKSGYRVVGIYSRFYSKFHTFTCVKAPGLNRS